MTLQIMKPDTQRFCKCLVFAPGGAGKTVLMGTAQNDERTSPMLILDFEGGTESLTGLDVDIAPIHTWEDYNEAYEMILSGDHGYRSLGIDSISETHKWALLDILRKEGPTRKDPDLLEQRDYGKATVLMRRMLRAFKDLPMHVFYTSHAKEIEVPREGRVRVPDMAGQMAEEVAGLMSVVGYLAQFDDDQGQTHRTLLLHSFPRYRIKARTPWGVEIPAELEDPTITDLLDALGYAAPSQNGVAKPRQRRPSARRKEQIAEGDAEVPTEGESPAETPAEEPAAAV